MKKATRLDVDESLLNSRLVVDPMPGFPPSPQGLTQLYPDTPPPVATIKPKPGMCIKTRRTDGEGSGKVFVNVCTSEGIPAPEDITQQELVEILESDEPSDFRVPMSIGEPHEEKDKGGDPCTAYDVIIHPSFLDKVRDDPLFNNFFIITAMEGLEGKYDIQIDKNGWKTLVNKLYHGKMSDQTIRTAVPLVQELSGRRKATVKSPSSVPAAITDKQGKDEINRHQRLLTPVNTKKIEAADTKKVKPKFVVRKVFGDEKQLVGIRAEVKLPGVSSGEDVSVYCGEDRLVLEHSYYFLDILLPCTMLPDSAMAHYASQQQTMVVSAHALEP